MTETPHDLDDVRDRLNDTIESLRAELAEAKGKIAGYRRRLEIDRAWVSKDGQLVETPMELRESVDGISCRDATIKLQDEALAVLRARSAALEASLIELRDFARDCGTGGPMLDRANAVLSQPLTTSLSDRMQREKAE